MSKPCCSWALDEYGGLDIVFNNAGVGGAIGPSDRNHRERLGLYVRCDCQRRLSWYQACGENREERRQGRVDHQHRIRRRAKWRWWPPVVYLGAKAAVISLSKSAAVELAPDLIRVNAICPGFIVTPLAAHTSPGSDGDDLERTSAAFAKSQRWPTYGTGDHIAGVALFLASDDSEFVTGEAILVDGGLTAAGPELSRKFPRVSSKKARVSGVTKGSTGEPEEIRRLD